MIYRFLIFLTLIILPSCSFNKVVKHHGVHFLDKKQEKLTIFETNVNDAQKILGPPSTKNAFDNDVWIYIERKTTVSELKTLGRRKILKNNVLVLEFNTRGILVKKDFYDKEQMNKVNIVKDESEVLSKKDGFVRSILTSLRQKINDPLGKRTAK